MDEAPTLIDVPADPNAPRLVELGDEGEAAVVIMNTMNPEVARRMIVEHFRHVYDDFGEADEYIDTLDDATFTIGDYWWHDNPGVPEGVLVDATVTPPPATFPGILVTFELGHL